MASLDDAIREAETYLAQQQTDAGAFDFSTAQPVAEEFDFATAQPSAPLPFYEQARQQTEQQIAQRPSSIDFLRQVAQQPSLAQQHPFQTGLNLAVAPFEAGESIPANIGLALQRGSFARLPQQLLQGVTGERPAQIGDIYRASGVPALQAIAPVAGMLLTGPQRSLAQTGVTAKLPTAIANIVRRPTSVASQFAKQVVTLPPRIMGKVGEKVVVPNLRRITEPITAFPYRKTLELKQGLIGYFREIGNQYADDIEKLSNHFQGVFPAEDLAMVVRGRLQRVGILDQTGNLIPSIIADLNPIERKLLSLYEDLATSPQAQIPIQDIVKQMRQLRKSIRMAARERNVPINADERVLTGVLHDVAKIMEPHVPGDVTVRGKTLLDINRDYAQGRTLFNSANRIFKVFKGEFETGTGEAALSGYQRLPQGTQRLLEEVERQTGVRFVQKAKAFSALRTLERSNQLVLAGLGAGIGSAVGGAGGATVGGAIGSGIAANVMQALSAGVPLARQAIPPFPPQVAAIVARQLVQAMHRQESGRRQK